MRRHRRVPGEDPADERAGGEEDSPIGRECEALQARSLVCRNERPSGRVGGFGGKRLRMRTPHMHLVRGTMLHASTSLGGVRSSVNGIACSAKGGQNFRHPGSVAVRRIGEG